MRNVSVVVNFNPDSEHNIFCVLSVPILGQRILVTGYAVDSTYHNM